MKKCTAGRHWCTPAVGVLGQLLIYLRHCVAEASGLGRFVLNPAQAIWAPIIVAGLNEKDSCQRPPQNGRPDICCHHRTMGHIILWHQRKASLFSGVCQEKSKLFSCISLDNTRENQDKTLVLSVFFSRVILCSGPNCYNQSSAAGPHNYSETINGRPAAGQELNRGQCDGRINKRWRYLRNYRLSYPGATHTAFLIRP